LIVKQSYYFSVTTKEVSSVKNSPCSHLVWFFRKPYFCFSILTTWFLWNHALDSQNFLSGILTD